MNRNNNLYTNNSKIARMFSDGFVSKMYNGNIICYWNPVTSKWMVLNNLGNYEEWGVMPTVNSLAGTTTYKGKLVILSTDTHEYKWNGTQWVDLGILNQIPIGWLDFNTNCWFLTDYKLSTLYNANHYLKIKYTANISDKYLFSSGQSPMMFSLENYTTGTSIELGTFYCIGSSAFVDHNGITKWYSNTSGWSSIQIHNNSVIVTNSDGQTATSSKTYSGTSSLNFAMLINNNRTSGYAAIGQFHNLCIWNEENGEPIHNYYATIYNGTPCLYDATTQTYLNNQISSPSTLPTFTQTGYLPGSVPESYPSQPKVDWYSSIDTFDALKSRWHYNISTDSEIVSDIANATKQNAFQTTDNKWYIKNNLGNYEQWGLLPTVATLEGVTTYTGKLVMLSTDSHEYKWNGTQWVDLGLCVLIPIGWLGVDGNAAFDTGLIIRNIYATNSYIKVTHTATTSGIGYFFGGGTNPWFSCEYNPDAGVNAKYWNIGNRTYIGSGNVVNPFQTATTTTGWASIELNATTILATNSSGQTYNTTTTWSGSESRSFILLNNVTKTNSFRGQFHHLSIFDSADEPAIHDYYATINNGIPCIYDAVTQTYLYNQITYYPTSPTFTQTGYLPSGVPEQYPERSNPSVNLTKTSYTSFISGSYMNGQHVTVNGLNYNVVNGEMVEQPLTYWLKGLTTSSYWTTNYIWNAQTEVEIKFMKDTAVDSWTTLFGTRVDSYTASGKVFAYINNDGVNYRGDYNGQADPGSVGTWTSGETYTVKLGKGKYWINDVLKYTYPSEDFGSNPYPVWIGALNQRGSQADHALRGQIYYVKIYENGTLVRNYMPQANQTFVCSLTGNIASLVGTAEYGHD